MKGLLLAGGHGTRLRPLTFSGNKHMIPIANEPMLFYGLRHLVDGGVTEVGIVLGPLHENIEETIGDGAAFGVRVRYIRQGDPKGLAHAVLCAREFLGNEPFVMYLGDNLLQEGARPLIERFRAEGVDAVVGATPVQDPSSYGVVELDGSRIVSIAEKPREPKSNLALIGIYVFSPAIHEVIADLKPSGRGELEITEAIWQLHLRGGRVVVQQVRGWWKDTGRPEDLLEANERVLRSLPAEKFVRSGTVSEGATLRGHVSLGEGSHVSAGCTIEGPTVIGRHVRVEGGARIGPSTAIGDHCLIRGATVRDSILMASTVVEGPVEIERSIVGRFARLQAHENHPAKFSAVLGDSSQLQF